MKNFPITNKGKLGWWNKSKSKLSEIYWIPEEEKYGTYYLTFWSFNGGCEFYKNNTFLDFSDHESYCFDDMINKQNCIDKRNEVMKINKTTTGDIRIQLREESYIQLKNGDIVKEK